MKRPSYIAVIVFLGCLFAFAVHAQELAKLPYASGQSFVVVQGYDSPPTHINKDNYAIDFSQDGCDAYAKQAVAAVSGKAWVVQQSGYNGGYGTQLLLLSDGKIVTRYAHMIPGSITVAAGAVVPQGTVIGEIGNTGLVMGTACPTHPGTHIHFAMDTENAAGTFTAKNPEPISGYTNITEGKWYRSDNALSAPEPTSDADVSEKNSLTAIVAESAGVTSTSTGSPAISATAQAPSTIISSIAPPPSQNIPPASVPIEPSSTLSVGPTSFTSSTLPLSSRASSSSASSTLPTSFPPPTVPNAGGGGGVVETPTIPDNSSESSSSSSGSGDNASSSNSTNASSTPSDPSSTTPFVIGTPQSPDAGGSIGSFNSSTLAVDLSWQPPTSSSAQIVYQILDLDATSSAGPTVIATTTLNSFSYSFPNSDFGHDVHLAVQAIDSADDESALATTTVSIPAWFSPIQPVEDNDSEPSWYNDNWYNLGTGFSGTIRSLTLEGYIDNDQFSDTQVGLEEFSDPNYTTLVHTFPMIDDETSFTQMTKKTTVNGLKIPLDPEKYYRLSTYQDWQNRSVILRGTDAKGTAMYDYFSGFNEVQDQYTFYPYVVAVIDPEELPINPPVMNGNLAVAFNGVSSQITVSWPLVTSPDEPLVQMGYQINISTSTTFDPSQWQPVVGAKQSSTLDVLYGNTYQIGVRAVNDFGAVSAPITTTWSFPPNYVIVPEQFDHSVGVSGNDGGQEITFLATTSVSAIDFFLSPIRDFLYPSSETYLSIYTDAGGAPGTEIPSGNPTVKLGVLDAAAESTYAFSAPIIFSPGKYWFEIKEGPDSLTNPTEVLGSAGNTYPGGYWSTSPGQDAFFRIYGVVEQ